MKRSPPPGTPLVLRILATFFFVGEVAPAAPATAASLILVPFLHPFLGWPAWIQLVVTAVVAWAAILVSTRAEEVYGHDASAIVIDEVAGMLVTFLLVPPGNEPASRWWILLAGFFLFRVFDVLKPFPAGRAQNLPRGQGVVADDLVAGLYANLGLRVLLQFL